MQPIYLIAIPLLAAFLSILSKKGAPYLLLIVALFNLVVSFIVKQGVISIGGFDLPYGITLFVDTYSQIGLILVNTLFFIVSLLNVKRHTKYASVLLISLVGLNGLLMTGDLFNLFVFLEIAGISAYILTTSHKKPVSTFQYLVMGSIGSSLYLFGLIILYSMFGTLNLMHMIHLIDISAVNYRDLILPFTLMFIGLGVEVKLLPLNAWVKGILKHANSLTGPMIASIYAATMSFVFGRLMIHLFQFEGKLLTLVTVLLVLGVILGEAMAFASKQIKEILLYSSISQVSIVMLLFLNGLTIWAVYLIIANAISKFILFSITTHLSKDHDDDFDHLSGVFKDQKVIGLSYTIATLSMIGLPLFVGFFIKVNYLIQLTSLNQYLIIIVILISAVIEGIYFIRLLVKLWFADEKVVESKFSLVFKVIVFTLAMTLVVFGNYTKPLDQLDGSIDQIQEEIEVIF